MSRTSSGGLRYKNSESFPSLGGVNRSVSSTSALFKDFDGVHYDATQDAASARSVQLDRDDTLDFRPSFSSFEVTTLDGRPESNQWACGPPKENMVYYPAPVPITLNLPQKLSTKNTLDVIRETKHKASGSKDLPPQLRASVFFEHKPVVQKVQLQESAVATLDTMLHESARAPIVVEKEESLFGGSDEETPNTLLAELQSRKEQQKSRNKTAATAFPNGMHSTLLELDAVEQVSKRRRQGERTTLAWEDEKPIGDEDVPLGLLYNKMQDWDKPLGLLDKRRQEENEPLSRRRLRLNPDAVQEETLAQRSRRLHSAKLLNSVKIEDGEFETLGQRRLRLKSETRDCPLIP